jgi:hypothetical protein
MDIKDEDTTNTAARIETENSHPTEINHIRAVIMRAARIKG